MTYNVFSGMLNPTQSIKPATTLPIYRGLGQAPNVLACIPSGVVYDKNKKWSEFVDERPHDRVSFSLGKFNVSLNCFCGRPVRMLVDSMRGNPDIMATGNGAQGRAGKSGRHPFSNVPLPVGSVIWTAI